MFTSGELAAYTLKYQFHIALSLIGPWRNM